MVPATNIDLNTVYGPNCKHWPWILFMASARNIDREYCLWPQLKTLTVNTVFDPNCKLWLWIMFMALTANIDLNTVYGPSWKHWSEYCLWPQLQILTLNTVYGPICKHWPCILFIAPATNIDREYCLWKLMLFFVKMVRNTRAGEKNAASNVKSLFHIQLPARDKRLMLCRVCEYSLHEVHLVVQMWSMIFWLGLESHCCSPLLNKN
jgi:hypothetical protein